MNLLYRSAESKNGSQKKILEGFRKEKYFDQCVLIDYSSGMDEYDRKYYYSISANVCYSHNYESICEYGKIPELDIDLLKKMEKYKSTFLHIAGLRPYNLYVEDYFALDDRYTKELRFWNYILDENKIDLAFFACIPHWEWEYVLYALCKCKDIDTLLICGTHVPGVSCVGTSIDYMGYSMVKEMKKNTNNWSKSCIIREIDSYLKKSSDEYSRYTYADKKKQKNMYHRVWHARRSKSVPRRCVLSDIKHGRNFVNSLKTLRQVDIARIDAKGMDYYNKMSVSEIKDEPFVYFALQLTPEATTLPWAGIFQNQLISIRMLAEIGRKYNVKIYVKEHFVQPCRPRIFYETLLGIPEVVLIDAYMDSYNLIRNSIANATQTGSVITESVINGKPVLSFVDGYWNGGSNVYVIHSKKELNTAFKDILGKKITQREIQENKEQYFHAMAVTGLRWKLDYDEKCPHSDDDIAEDAVDLLGQYLESEKSDSFVYIRKECRL